METSLIQTKMNLELEGKRAFVTGSTAGIGYAIGEALAGEGGDAVVKGRTEEGAAKSASSKRFGRFDPLIRRPRWKVSPPILRTPTESVSPWNGSPIPIFSSTTWAFSSLSRFRKFPTKTGSTFLK